MAVVLLSSLAELKNALDVSGQNQDGWLKTLLRMVSAQLAADIDRRDAIAIVERTELINVRAEQVTFAVKADPIASVNTIRWDIQQQFSSGTLFDPDDFIVETDEGLITFHFAILPAYSRRAPKSLQVIYTGGIASNLAGLRQSRFAELEMACQLWCQSIYKRQRLDPQEFRSSGQGGSISLPPLSKPPIVRDIVRRLRRRPVAA